MPLSNRRVRLEALIPAREGALWFSSSVEGAVGAALFRHACGMGLEGIVSKRLDSSYRSGATPAWRKHSPVIRKTRRRTGGLKFQKEEKNSPVTPRLCKANGAPAWLTD